MSILKARSPFHIKHTEPSPPPPKPPFTCKDANISGMAIAQDGTVTAPTVGTGTLISFDPSSFGTVPVDTTHNVIVKVEYDATNFSPPSQTSTTISCLIQVPQVATPPAPITVCQEHQVINNHGTDAAFVNYRNCSNQSTTIFVPALSNQIICVYPNTVPTVMVGFNLAFAINLQTTCT